MVVRSSEDSISAFYNVCPHRGNILFFDNFGFVKILDVGFMDKNLIFFYRSNQEVSDSETFREEVLCYDHDLSQLKVERDCGKKNLKVGI